MVHSLMLLHRSKLCASFLLLHRIQRFLIFLMSRIFFPLALHVTGKNENRMYILVGKTHCSHQKADKMTAKRPIIKFLHTKLITL